MNSYRFAINPWLGLLYPLVFLCGLVVCIRFRRVSPHMPWLIVAFAGLLAPDALPLLTPWPWLSQPNWHLVMRALHPLSDLLLVIGLARVLDGLRPGRGHSRRDERPNDAYHARGLDCQEAGNA